MSGEYFARGAQVLLRRPEELFLTVRQPPDSVLTDAERAEVIAEKLNAGKSLPPQLGVYPEKIDVVSDGRNAENTDVVICRLVTFPLMMPDNLLGHCSKCFRMVQFRPHAPKTPKRMCDECAWPEVLKQMRQGGFKSVITPKTAADLAAFFGKKGQH